MGYRAAILACFLLSAGAAAAEDGIVAEGFKPPVAAPAAKTAAGSIKISKATVDFSGGEYRVPVSGKTDLPDGTRIYVFLKKGEFPLSCRVSRAAGGKFSAELGPFKAKLPLGAYAVEASVSAAPGAGAKDTFRLAVGSAGDIMKEEESNRVLLGESLASAAGLFAELEEKYTQGREEFDPAEWKRWSEGWTSTLRQRQQAVDNNVRPLTARDYSGPSQALSQALRDLDQLERVYTAELAGGGIKDAYPYAFRDPAQLKAVINESLKNSKKVILTNCDLNGI